MATERQVYEHLSRRAYEDLKGSFRRLVDGGEAMPATVTGRRGFYLHPEHLDHEAGPRRGRTALLSPFDNLIADRVPAAKRKRGYYVLPILSGDRLIGSADVRFDRDARRLIVQKLLFEEGFGMSAAVQRAIDEPGTFVSANGGAAPDKVSAKSTPGQLPSR